MNARVYPTLAGKHVSIAAEGTLRLLSFDAWTMAEIFEGARNLFP
ncbi:hypothetical protein [Arthrobacter sp. FW306-2-2C-D06B]|nr:hypothetical protein [Arthrobacter sp. FW306-2-2C-D06B]